jgi:hypothetical protein
MKLLTLPLLLLLWSCSNPAENPQNKKFISTISIQNTADPSETTVDKNVGEFDKFSDVFQKIQAIS